MCCNRLYYPFLLTTVQVDERAANSKRDVRLMNEVIKEKVRSLETAATEQALEQKRLLEEVCL